MRIILIALLFLPAGATAVFAETTSATSLLPLESSQRTMVFTEGEHEGDSIDMSLRQTEDSGVWLLRIGELLEAELQRNDDGDLVLRRIESPKEQKVIGYSPPVIFLPASLGPETSIDQEVETTVVNRQTGETEYQTSVTHTLHAPTPTTFDTRGGSYSGYQVDISQQGTFDLSTLEAGFSAGFVKDSGLIYANLTYTADKPLFFGDGHSHTVEIAEPLPQDK